MYRTTYKVLDPMNRQPSSNRGQGQPSSQGWKNMFSSSCKSADAKMETTVICKRCNTHYSVPKPESKCKCFVPTDGQSGNNQERHHRFSQYVRNFAQRFEQGSSSNESTYVSSLNVKPSGTGSAEKHPRKRALLCGVTYNKKKYRLKGTVNDVKSMRDFLMRRYGYPAECIRVLTEDEKEDIFSPTKKNIQESLKWLVEGSESGDSLVFYFSGHGLRQPDFNNDESDGFDETICPVDFMQEGMILDNEINSTIVWPLKKGVTLHAIVDACHSGTILDLEYIYKPEINDWDDNSAPSKARKSTSGGIAICLSACDDDKMAADTTAFTGKAMAGAMTYLMIETINKDARITYGHLLERMREMVEEFNDKSSLGKFLPTIFYHRKMQECRMLCYHRRKCLIFTRRNFCCKSYVLEGCKSRRNLCCKSCAEGEVRIKQSCNCKDKCSF